MKRYVLPATAIALALVSSMSAGQQQPVQPAPAAATAAPAAAIATQKATIDQYCVTCHNQRTKTRSEEHTS